MVMVNYGEKVNIKVLRKKVLGLFTGIMVGYKRKVTSRTVRKKVFGFILVRSLKLLFEGKFMRMVRKYLKNRAIKFF